MLLSLFATAGFIHAFVYRRRAYLWLFAIALELMLYTQSFAFLFWVGLAVALVAIDRCSAPEHRRQLRRDIAISFARRGAPVPAVAAHRRSLRSRTTPPRGTTRRCSARPCPAT